MVLDSSAVVAIFLKEPGYERLLERMGQSESIAIGAPTAVELVIVLSARLRRDARPDVMEFLREASVEVLPFGEDHWSIAVAAFLKYGKGRHRAALNFGDCLTYASAYVAGLPLLYAGDDFTWTDIAPG